MFVRAHSVQGEEEREEEMRKREERKAREEEGGNERSRGMGNRNEKEKEKKEKRKIREDKENGPNEPKQRWIICFDPSQQNDPPNRVWQIFGQRCNRPIWSVYEFPLRRILNVWLNLERKKKKKKRKRKKRRRKKKSRAQPRHLSCLPTV
jgi:hypothetical protein